MKFYSCFKASKGMAVAGLFIGLSLTPTNALTYGVQKNPPATSSESNKVVTRTVKVIGPTQSATQNKQVSNPAVADSLVTIDKTSISTKSTPPAPPTQNTTEDEVKERKLDFFSCVLLVDNFPKRMGDCLTYATVGKTFAKMRVDFGGNQFEWTEQFRDDSQLFFADNSFKKISVAEVSSLSVTGRRHEVWTCYDFGSHALCYR